METVSKKYLVGETSASILDLIKEVSTLTNHISDVIYKIYGAEIGDKLMDEIDTDLEPLRKHLMTYLEVQLGEHLLAKTDGATVI